MKTIKTCIIAATLCIVFLTGLAAYLLISNFNSLGSNIPIQTEQCDNTCNQATKSDQSQTPAKNNNTTEVNASNADQHNGLLDSIVYNVTLAVNSVNNVITTGSIFIGIITLFIGIVGLFGYHHLKEDINKYSSIFRKTEALVKSADELKQSLIAQQTYIEKSNESLMKTVYAIANHIQDEETARELLKQQSHIAEIINLYRPCINPEDLVEVRNKKIASLLYLLENGTIDDLTDLQYILEHDQDKDVRAKAQEVIIRIKSRASSGGTGCCLTRIKNWLSNL